MHARHVSARLAPKKANIVAKMVRGLPVPVATELLRKTSKKAARLFEDILRSAVANASHNFKQDPQTMIVKTVVVNQGTAYRRGVPMARGRVRPIRKFLCHIEITLGFPGQEKTNQRSQKKQGKQKNTPQESKTSVKAVAKKTKGAKHSSASLDSSVSSPK
jgi:large subunit ribosomal protein L22